MEADFCVCSGGRGIETGRDAWGARCAGGFVWLALSGGPLLEPMLNAARPAKPIERKVHARTVVRTLDVRASPRLRQFSKLIDVALIVELPHFRIAKNRGSPRNLGECEMHHVVDISASRPIGLFQNSIGGQNVLGGGV